MVPPWGSTLGAGPTRRVSRAGATPSWLFTADQRRLFGARDGAIGRRDRDHAVLDLAEKTELAKSTVYEMLLP